MAGLMSKIKLILWAAILVFCLLCSIGFLPILPPIWFTWISAFCALASVVLEVVEHKKRNKQKVVRNLIAFACILPLISLFFRSGTDSHFALGCSDWVVVAFLYLTLFVSIISGFITKGN